MYKEILQLTMIDDFLDMVKYDFANKVWPKLEIKGNVVYSLPPQYEHRFQAIMMEWEKTKHLQQNESTTS